MTLQDFIIEHTERGACMCGECADYLTNAEDLQPTGHTADVGFFKVSAKGDPDKKALIKLIFEHKGEYDQIDLFDGQMHDIIQLGAFVGDQGLGMMLMGLGQILGLWKVRILQGYPIMQAKADRLFAGSLRDGKPVVQVVKLPSTEAQFLDPAPSQSVYNHSPDGFNWGYSGSGPAQLALAILLEIGLDTDRIKMIYQDFKREVIAGFPKEGWLLPQSKIVAWLILQQ